MKNEQKAEREEIISLNSEVSEFDLKQLEERLETDPLAVGGLFDLASTQDLSQSVHVVTDCECNDCWFNNN